LHCANFFMYRMRTMYQSVGVLRTFYARILIHSIADMVDSANQFVQMNVVRHMLVCGYSTALKQPQYAVHAKLENLFHSSLNQLRELRRQRLAVVWRPRNFKAWFCSYVLLTFPDILVGSPCSIAPPSLDLGERTVISHKTPTLEKKVHSVDTSDSNLEILAMTLSGVKISIEQL